MNLSKQSPASLTRGLRVNHPRNARRAAGVALALLAVVATTACVRLPETGPVVTTQDNGQTEGDPGIYFNPRPPQAGDSPSTIVEGFLRAMTATPIQTTVARQFLTKDAQAAWNPEQRVITYDSRDAPMGEQTVQVTLDGARWVDSRGAWRGRLGNGTRTVDFAMTQEDGEWRISAAPDALIVDELWFQGRFTQASAYFFDPTANILVPEPVFVPADAQLAAALVESVLAGPPARLAGVVRTFVPAGLTLALSVPVDDEGIADITLQGDVGQLTPQAAELMVDQLAWTLRQDPTIKSFRVSIGGEPVTLPTGSNQFSVDLGSEFDPTDVRASSQLFVVRDGLLTSGTAEETVPVAGLFGDSRFGIESLAVSLAGNRAAAVTGGGSSLLRGPVAGDGQVREVLSGAGNLLRPSWDFADRLWVVDRSASGAQVSVLTRDEAQPVQIPGVTGRDVKRFLVSRDGSRFVAVIRGSASDRLVVSRIRHDAEGRIVGATQAHTLDWNAGDVQRIRDIGWRTPTSVAVLHLLTRDISQVVTIPVDGSPAGAGSPALTQRQRARGLVASPVSTETLFTLTAAGLYDLTGREGGNHPLPEDTESVQYVG